MHYEISVYTVFEKLSRPWNGAKNARTGVAGNYEVITCLWRGIFKHCFRWFIPDKSTFFFAKRALGIWTNIYAEIWLRMWSTQRSPAQLFLAFFALGMTMFLGNYPLLQARPFRSCRWACNADLFRITLLVCRYFSDLLHGNRIFGAQHWLILTLRFPFFSFLA